jgi:hypothetical protein
LFLTRHITSHSSRTNNSWLFARTSLILANNHLPLNGALCVVEGVVQNQKYEHLFTVVFFILLGLFVSVLLAVVRSLWDGSSIIELLKAPVFLSLTAFAIGLVFCEIKAYIKSKLIASLLFGVVTPIIFFASLFIDSIITDGFIKPMVIDFYVWLFVILGALSSSIYWGLVRNNT